MTSRAQKLASIAEWDALLARYPVGSWHDLFRQGTVVLTGNVVILYLLVVGRLQPVELVALVALEAVLLTVFAWVPTRMVPASAVMGNSQSVKERLGTAAFGLFWLGGVYALTVGAFLNAWPQMLEAVRHPVATLLRSDLLWPLAITVAAALIDSVRDWQHWRAHGGYFLSTPGFNAIARWLTLFLGGIPFFIPMVVVVWSFKTIIDRVIGRTTGSSGGPRPGLAVALSAGLCLAVFGVMGWLIEGGTSGWAIGYCSAKLASEAFIAFMPVIASKARAEEAAALGRRTADPGSS